MNFINEVLFFEKKTDTEETNKPKTVITLPSIRNISGVTA